MMGPAGSSAEWYYVGHYGQLGPLTMSQIEELIRDGVIDKETFVWHGGLANWERAGNNSNLAGFFAASPYAAPPPPPPTMGSQPGLGDYRQPVTPSFTGISGYGAYGYDMATLPVSDKSRLLAGILQLCIPGVGRMYLGYAAHGVLQLLLTPLGCLSGWIWSIVDGIVILSGGLKLDGYGRRLPD